MSALALGLIGFGSHPSATTALLVAWGLFGTAAPVGWGTWLSRVLAEEAEVGGGLQVAVIQFAITAGAAIGGMLFDAFGWWSPFLLGACLLAGSSLAAFAAWLDSGYPK